MYVGIGTKRTTRVLDAKATHGNLGESITVELPVLHVSTANDCTSAFHGNRKEKAMKRKCFLTF